MTDHELEAFLQTLQPRRLPSRVLAPAPIEAETAKLRPAAGWLHFWRHWPGWSCAALFAAGVVASRLMVTPHAGASTAVPAPVASIVVQGGEQDFVTLPDGSPARRYRIHSLETVSWTDPKTRASLRWTLPREDIEVVPVRAY